MSAVLETGPIPLTTSRATRRLLGIAMVMHGLAPFLGTSDAYGALSDDDRAVTCLFDQWTVNRSMALVVAGTVWAVVGDGFAIASIGAIVDRVRWRPTVTVLAGVSLVLCAIGLSAAFIGIVVNVTMLGGVSMRNGQVRSYS